jgi:hypothetical protein
VGMKMKSLDELRYYGLEMPTTGHKRVDIVVLNKNDIESMNYFSIVSGPNVLISDDYIKPTLASMQEMVGIIYLENKQ